MSVAFVRGTEHLCSLKPLSGHFHGYHAAQSFTVALKIIASVLLPTVENCRQLSQCSAFITTERWAQDHHTRREKCMYLPEITLDSNLPQCSINIQVLPIQEMMAKYALKKRFKNAVNKTFAPWC